MTKVPFQPIIFTATMLLIAISGCATTPPKNVDDICAIFEEKPGWYESARESYRKWHVPIPVMLAIVHQESSFVANARPARTKILWIFPGPRPSTAYGYAQALESTWKTYIKSTGNRGADRDDFGDVMDFIGWYCDLSHQKCGISKRDSYHLYLAYHEGQKGFNDNTYRGKEWLLQVADRVEKTALIYSRQLDRCRGKLEGEKKKKRFLFF